MTTMALIAMMAQAGAQPPGVQPLTAVERLPAIPEFPDPFTMLTGIRVESPRDWPARRAEIQSLLLYYQYGHLPPAPPVKGVEVSSTPVLDGAATEKLVRITCGPDDALQFSLLVTIPRGRTQRRPVILDGDLCWRRVNGLAEAVERGYIVAEFDRTELDGDNADRKDGVHPLYPQYDWGTLAAWAWGFHRAVDYLVTQPYVDTKRIAVTGHSRGGKTALLAGALDPRVALVAPNDSGCGGAGSYRHQNEKSETLAAILKNFPYWFNGRLQEFLGREECMPFDQHFLWALVAPRPLLVTNAFDDRWANPEGTQRTYLAAREVYRFLGAPDRVGIHYRPGKHEHSVGDWHTLLDFADRHFFGKEVETRFDTLPFPVEPKGFSWGAPGTGSE